MRLQNKGTIYISIITVSLALVLFYLHERTGQLEDINSQIAKIRAEKLSMSGEMAAQGKVGNILPAKAGIAEFVEDLFDAARISGIKKHEVSTVKTIDLPQRKNAMKGRSGESGKELKTYSLKISLEGNYRDTAEYIREMQNIKGYMQMVELGMKPADKILKTDITVEIVSIGGQNAAQ
jgi:Tfp pilus assembly protein PilO